jgi:hypothetical protein
MSITLGGFNNTLLPTLGHSNKLTKAVNDHKEPGYTKVLITVNHLSDNNILLNTNSSSAPSNARASTMCRSGAPYIRI